MPGFSPRPVANPLAMGLALPEISRMIYSKTLKAELLLVLAAVIWGLAFVAQRLGMDHVGPFTYNGVRFILGALTFATATVGINIVANFISPAFDFSHVAPQKISWRMGGMIAAIGS